MPKKSVQKVSTNVESLYSVRNRHFFTWDKSILEVPKLIEVQLESYQDFLDNILDSAFQEVFPISDFSGEKIDIFYKSLSLEYPEFSFQEYKKRNMNYEAGLRVCFETLNKETGEIKEDTVFMWGVPLMTERGTFVINGIEKVVVNQIIKSDGLFFEPDKALPGMYTARIKPKKGVWLEIMVDRKNVLYVRIDKKRKIPITVLLRAFGLETDAKIIKAFKQNKEFLGKYIEPTIAKDKTKTRIEALHFIYKLLRPGDLGTDERVTDLFETTFFDKKRFDLGQIARIKVNQKLGMDVKYEDEEGYILQKEDLILTIQYLMGLLEGLPGHNGDDIDRLSNRRIRSVGELVYDKLKIGLARMERIAKDRMTVIDLEDATARDFINHRPIEAVLKEFFASGQLSQFMDQSNPLSEIAHKRRISAMGPGGLTRERASFEVRDVHPTQYGRICPIATPEGPNIGLVLHLASYAKVDKYGFLTTPYRLIQHYVENNGKEAINRITLEDIVDEKWKIIVSAKEYITKELAEDLKKKYKEKQIHVRGFLTNESMYIGVHEEQALTIAEANTKTDEFGNFADTRISVRHNNEPTLSYVSEVTHIDISPKQIMSISTSLLPFLEHDDATRAEMGTNMMRQACPLLHPDSPIVGTGMERVVGEQSGYVIVAEEDGQVIGVDAKHISVLYKNGKKKTFNLTTFERSNQDMVVHQLPLMSRGDSFKKNSILADAQAIENGELALGKNLLVAYMPWGGYNFEDAVIINSRLVEEDVFTNISIQEYVLDVRETKLWPEQTTSDIPNVSYVKLKDLDENGIIRIGASVKGGDILVGKITPKGEQELSPEERLLRAIFGDKSKDVKDSSLYLPSGAGGKIIDIQILRKENGDNLPTGVFEQIKIYIGQTRKIEIGDKMAGRHGNKGIVACIVPEADMPFNSDGIPMDIVLNPLGVISRMNIGQLLETHLGMAAKMLGIKVATPILNGIKPDMISKLMKKVGMSKDGKQQLFDGRTWEPFKEKTTVGIAYMLKLHHLVEDKIHARSVGPYSMITQQPLGGKAQNGGQRFGEMECWAIQGYGAANILQEMLTIKSDDITGRSQAYQAIVKNEWIRRPSVPESFNVLLTELQALNLKIGLLNDEEVTITEAWAVDRFKYLDNLEIPVIEEWESWKNKKKKEEIEEAK